MSRLVARCAARPQFFRTSEIGQIISPQIKEGLRFLRYLALARLCVRCVVRIKECSSRAQRADICSSPRATFVPAQIAQAFNCNGPRENTPTARGSAKLLRGARVSAQAETVLAHPLSSYSAPSVGHAGQSLAGRKDALATARHAPNRILDEIVVHVCVRW